MRWTLGSWHPEAPSGLIRSSSRGSDFSTPPWQPSRSAATRLATVDEIAVAAGASRATFYLHFSSKAELVRALYAEVEPDIEQYYSALDDVLANGTRHDFRGWLQDALGWFDRNQAVVQAFEQVIASHDPIVAETNYPYADYMPQFLGGWPTQQHLEARTRVWMFVILVSVVHRMWRVLGQMGDVGEDLMIDLLEDVGGAALHLPRPDGPGRR